MKKTVIGVIPARYQSARLPGKPLCDIGGKTLIQRVWEQTSKASNLSEVIIATDDSRIEEAAISFGARVMMTSDKHTNGSERIAEVVTHLQAEGEQIHLVVNIQGDMPFINPQIIDSAIVDVLEGNDNYQMGTIAIPIEREEEFLAPGDVKVVIDTKGKALYFSRAAIPFTRDKNNGFSSALKHVGLYLYSPETLLNLIKLPASPLEKKEKLEQLRAIENGIDIKVTIIDRELMLPGIEVDTAEDLKRANKYISRK